MPRVLIVDDNEAVLAAIQGYLDLEGFAVATAISGRAGIEAAEEGDFDVVIVDLFLPDIDGLSVIAAIRRHAPGLPLIAISGMEPDALATARRLGADGILSKPFSGDDLTRAVDACLGPVFAIDRVRPLPW